MFFLIDNSKNYIVILTWPGFNPITHIFSSENFSVNGQKILKPQNFSEKNKKNIICRFFGAASWADSWIFLQKFLIGTQCEKSVGISEKRKFVQKTENFSVGSFERWTLKVRFSNKYRFQTFTVCIVRIAFPWVKCRSQSHT